jgi:hypothetical protein
LKNRKIFVDHYEYEIFLLRYNQSLRTEIWLLMSEIRLIDSGLSLPPNERIVSIINMGEDYNIKVMKRRKSMVQHVLFILSGLKI